MELCEKAGCGKLVNGKCSVYSPDGVAFRNRQGYCPIPDFPRKNAPKGKKKMRVGQQKQQKP